MKVGEGIKIIQIGVNNYSMSLEFLIQNNINHISHLSYSIIIYQILK